MKICYLIFVAINLFVSVTYASEFSYAEIRDWHNDKINNVLKINSQEKYINFALDISKKNFSSSASSGSAVKLPGILISEQGDVLSQNDDQLPTKTEIANYRRSLTLILYKDVDPKVLSKLESELKSLLFFSTSDSLEIVSSNPFPYTENAIEDEYKGPISKTYDILARNSLIIWIFLLCGLTLYILLELKKIMQDASNRISSAILDMQAKLNDSNENPLEDLNKGLSDNGTLETNSSVDKFTPEATVLITNLYIAIQKYPGHLTASLYKVFYEPDSLLKLFNFLDQSQVIESQQNRKDYVLDFLKQLLNTSNNFSLGSIEIDINERVRAISNILTAFKFLKISPNSEKVYQAVFSKAKSRYYHLIEALVHNYFDVIYFTFPDDLKIYMKENPDSLKDFSAKIIDIDSKGIDVDSIDELRIKKFLNEIIIIDIKEIKTKISKDGTFSKMVWYLSEEELIDLEQKNGFESINNVPRISWLKGRSEDELKRFLLSLNPYELYLISVSVGNFEKVLQRFDQRTAYRFREIILSVDPKSVYEDKNIWFKTRQKISTYFNQPEVLRSEHGLSIGQTNIAEDFERDEDDTKKAS